MTIGHESGSKEKECGPNHESGMTLMYSHNRILSLVYYVCLYPDIHLNPQHESQGDLARKVGIHGIPQRAPPSMRIVALRSHQPTKNTHMFL